MNREPFDPTQADLQGVIARLENWGRWARDHAARARARSAEGRYRPERGDIEPRRTPEPDIDARDASVIDRAMAPIRGFPIRWSRLLKAHYEFRALPAATCRRLYMPRSEYEMQLRMASAHLLAVLTRARR